METEKEEATTRNEPENVEEPQQSLAIPMKLNMDVNMGINLSIILTLMIFCGLLFLPAKMLLDTSYEVANDDNDSSQIRGTANGTNFLKSMKFRERKMCPGLNYEYWLSSIFFSNYDRNCTYTKKRGSVNEQERRTIVEGKDPEKLTCTNEKKKETVIVHNYNGTFEETRAPSKPKSVPVTGHILAMMLVVSAIAAFVEVLRIRFINPKDTSTVETASSRKGSTIELMPHGRFLSRGTIKAQRSLEIQGMQRSAQRLLGTCPPPLTRRSSFPTYLVTSLDIATNGDVRTSRSMSRRTSINAESLDAGASTLHRRARLIRRH